MQAVRMVFVHLLIFTISLSQGHAKYIDQAIEEAFEDGTAYDSMDSVNPKVYRVELDILMTEEQYKRNYDENGRTRRKAITPAGTYRWINKEVPYIFEADTFSENDMARINTGIEQWNTHTCLNFRPAVGGDTNKIKFRTGSGCSSYIGMIGGEMPVTLASGCRYKYIVVHELGHAAGFYHEQSRNDRDSYVEIIEDKIRSGKIHNFRKAANDRVSNYTVKYDYRSIMHYSKKAFSSDGSITIRTKDPAFQDIIGKASNLSFLDVKLANVMYNCNEGCDIKQCPDPGFQGKNCDCLCPSDDPNEIVKMCNPRPPCRNRIFLCSRLRRFCRIGPVRLLCPATCDNCDSGAKPEPDLEPDSVPCIDVGKHCSFLKAKGNCEKDEFIMYMATNCPQTCGFCEPEAGDSE